MRTRALSGCLLVYASSAGSCAVRKDRPSRDLRLRTRLFQSLPQERLERGTEDDQARVLPPAPQGGSSISGRHWPCPAWTSTSEAAIVGFLLLDGTDNFRVLKGKHSVSFRFECSQRLLRLEVGRHPSPHSSALGGVEGVDPCALQHRIQG